MTFARRVFLAAAAYGVVDLVLAALLLAAFRLTPASRATLERPEPGAA